MYPKESCIIFHQPIRVACVSVLGYHVNAQVGWDSQDVIVITKITTFWAGNIHRSPHPTSSSGILLFCYHSTPLTRWSVSTPPPCLPVFNLSIYHGILLTIWVASPHNYPHLKKNESGINSRWFMGVLSSTLPETNSSLQKICRPRGKIVLQPFIFRCYDGTFVSGSVIPFIGSCTIHFPWCKTPIYPNAAPVTNSRGNPTNPEIWPKDHSNYTFDRYFPLDFPPKIQLNMGNTIIPPHENSRHVTNFQVPKF